MLKKLSIALGLIACSTTFNVQAQQEYRPIFPAASQSVLEIAPVFDFHNNGCLPDVGVDRYGQMNPGIEPVGGLGENCRNEQFLKQSNTLHRALCMDKTTDTGESRYCGHIYSLYFTKDQSIIGERSGHAHDWEFAVIYTKDGNITHAGYSAHGKVITTPINEIETQGKQVKVVYRKDGNKTHAFSFAEPGEKAQNPYNRFVTPAVVSWFEMRGENLSNEEMRYAFNNHDFKAGNVPVSDDNFVRNLNKGKPESYPEFYLNKDAD